jgi:serine/threonine protein kinase
MLTASIGAGDRTAARPMRNEDWRMRRNSVLLHRMGARLGRYVILKHLASGGMADVLLARTDGLEGFERHVVIKRIRPELAHDGRFIRMFLDEARVAATLHHQNIVQVHDVGEAGGEYFIAMEYVHGEDTRRVLENAARARSHVPLGYALAIISSAAAGLHHAHERLGSDRQPLHIVHRDVSPSNILIGYDGSVKLLDFGIATVSLLPDSRSTGLKGKLAYMSPEQIQGGAVDRRSDVYALGVVLYELVTTTPMIKADSEPAVMDQIVRGRIAAPQSRRPELPSELSAIIQQAIAPDRDRRYATADELRVALDQFAWNTGLTAPASSLAAYLRQQFGERPEPWLDLEEPGAMEFEDIAVSTVEAAEDFEDPPPAEPRVPEPADDWAEQPRTTDERPHTSGLLARSDVGATTTPAQRPPPTAAPGVARSRLRLAAIVAAGAGAAVAIWLVAWARGPAPEAPPAPPPLVAAAPPPVVAPPLVAAAAPPDAADSPEDAMTLAEPSPGRRGHGAPARAKGDRPARVALAAARSAESSPSTPRADRVERAGAASDAPGGRAEEPTLPAPAPGPVTTPSPIPPPDAAPAPVRPSAPAIATPAAPTAPQVVVPAALEANRIGGDKTIIPDAVTQDAITRAGVESVVSTYKLCVAADGEVSLITQMRSTGFAAYDDKIRSTIRATWRYRPYLVDGRATPVCTALRFVYSQRQ